MIHSTDPNRDPPMPYVVPCECGIHHSVEATTAGSRLPCQCGREITVPSLSKLKQAAGESAGSAEVRIEHLLRKGLLPGETTCVECRVKTSSVWHCWVTCERPKVEQATGWGLSAWNYVSLFFGTLIFRRVRRDRVEGRDLSFRLPLRVCPSCQELLADPVLLRRGVMEVPLYAELLQKYPEAGVSLDLGLDALTSRPARDD